MPERLETLAAARIEGRQRQLIGDRPRSATNAERHHRDNRIRNGPWCRPWPRLFRGRHAGLISEVIVADGGSRDDTAAVADVAGCNFRVVEGPLGRRLKTAAAAARAPWLLFLRPGTILDAAWTGEARRFVEQPSPKYRAAVFRRGAPAQPALRDVFSLLAAALGARPRPEQGLLISRQFYDVARRPFGWRRRSRNRPHPPHRPAADRDAGDQRPCCAPDRYLTKSSIWPKLGS